MTKHEPLLAILGEVDDLLVDEHHWCRKEQARTFDGHPVGPFDRAATSWCLTGAIDRVCLHHPIYHHQEGRLKAMLNAIVGPTGVETFNDNVSFSEVKDLIDQVREQVLAGGS